jgi:hypothetical protein
MERALQLGKEEPLKPEIQSFPMEQIFQALNIGDRVSILNDLGNLLY